VIVPERLEAAEIPYMVTGFAASYYAPWKRSP
jgi:hypothetical protein